MGSTFEACNIHCNGYSARNLIRNIPSGIKKERRPLLSGDIEKVSLGNDRSFLSSFILKDYFET